MDEAQAYKCELRAKYRRMRRALDLAERGGWDAAIAETVAALPEYAAADSLLCYVSTAEEVSTRAILERALKDGLPVAAPVCVGRTMVFRRFRSLGELAPGYMGILTPGEKCAEARAGGRTLCVVPGLAFDREGYRLGYGGGYYDRFLADFPGVTVGLCYEALRADHLPRGAFDIPVGRVVTERG